ncbi:peptidylprolyl isomerase [Gloeocapsopsis dulcis]|uniref:peptidylprolyl isomerase n=1 Tax=Gloeocapsopsis dulcis AAB1 = 1H9 TaxID=1433147 RepID=A0A6N8FVK9_9CHRO|nr:peptidylprolyl isomerase [Gloeocapsopsis dulcis]MUL35986.1 peptidylprolyl isomerase [Gloeocapsopsis dulcis AAB1 = 1H9]WNN88240.1 peptidylprolyl isomerase [Gloeocapsopsis dulcis]
MQTGSQEQVDGLLALLSRYQLMPQLVRSLMIDQAIADIPCTEEERQTAIAAFEAQQQITPTTRQAWLDQQGMSLAQMQELAVRPVLLEKHKTTVWGPKVDNYFLTRKAHLDQVVYSLIRTKDMGLAQEIYFRILEGEQSFAELAREHSQGAEAKTSGLLGPVPLAQPHPAISKLLSVSQPGQLWAPRPLAEWVVIVRLEKLMPARLDKSMRRRLQDELFETWLAQKMQQVDLTQFVTASLRDCNSIS